MKYKITASTTVKPSTAGVRCASAPASVANTKVQPILMSTIPLITAKPYANDRFQKASASAVKVTGTISAIKTFRSVHSPSR